MTKNGQSVKDLVGFNQDGGQSRNNQGGNGDGGNSSKMNTSGRAGSSFR